MIKTQIKLKPLLILSDGSSFKNVFTFKQTQFKSKDFKQIQFKSKKKLLSNNNTKLNELIYRKQLFT